MPRQPSASPVRQDLGAGPAPTRPHRGSLWAAREERKPSPGGPGGEQLPSACRGDNAALELPTPVSQPRGQGQEHAARFSGWKTEPISVTGSSWKESIRPRFESRLSLPPGETSSQGCDLLGCFHISIRRLRGRDRDRDRLPHSSPLSNRPQAPGDMLS